MSAAGEGFEIAGTPGALATLHLQRGKRKLKVSFSYLNHT